VLKFLFVSQKSKNKEMKMGRKLMGMAILVAFFFQCCETKISSSGISSDINTGLKATYRNMQPGDVSLVMNGSELSNADIPIGESFILVNDKTKGLTEKDGKVSVGCSLLIKDEAGVTLMDEPDLFKDNDILEASETHVLRCTVNTGRPMKVNEQYQVTATFWDKYGDGNIVNKVKVRMVEGK
jgi:hypothetical protein